MPTSPHGKKTHPTPWRPAILVLDDEWSTLERIRTGLSSEYTISAASRAKEALEVMAKQHFEVVLTDLRMPDMDGLSLVREMKNRYPETEYILMTAFSDIEDTISAIRLGVSDYLRKPFTLGEVRHALNRCLEQRRLEMEVASLRMGSHRNLGDVISVDPRMQEVLRMAETVTGTDVTILIGGETGTGKGLLARSIHNAGPRREKPYMEINCAALPANLIESELFGRERGSFTGAVSRKIGRVEAANGGTLLLDEIGEMSLDMQAKMLRFLQEFTYERVGGTTKLHADVRVIAATNRDLRQAVREGHFREDLFYRLHVIQLFIPPLRERREDILPLADYFLNRFCVKYGRKLAGFSANARQQMLDHPWPGNVREMEHAVERGVILCRGERIQRLDLAPVPSGPDGEDLVRVADPNPVSCPQSPPGLPETFTDQSLSQFLDSCERSYLENLLAHNQGNIGATAKQAQINPKTLYLKMNRHGLSKKPYRDTGGGGAQKTQKSLRASRGDVS